MKKHEIEQLLRRALSGWFPVVTVDRIVLLVRRELKKFAPDEAEGEQNHTNQL